jgi:hypothetical protein
MGEATRPSSMEERLKTVGDDGWELVVSLDTVARFPPGAPEVSTPRTETRHTLIFKRIAQK